MPYNGSGTFISLAPPNFPAVPGTVIQASQFNNNMQDIFTAGLTNCITRDGQSPPVANLPMGGFKLTGLTNGTADTDSAALGQVLGLRGQVGTVDWDTRVIVGLYEATAASLAGPSANFPPTSELGQLCVIPQGATIEHVYVTGLNTYQRRRQAGVWSSWVTMRVNPNYILNSGFSHWQAGTSLGAGTGQRYLADMCSDISVGSTYTATQLAFALGQTDVDSQAQFCKRTVVTSVANAANFALLSFPIEYVRTLAGQQVTVSFWARSFPNAPVSIAFSQFFGAGGAPSAQVDTFVAKVNLTGVWTRVSATVTLPSVSGKTLGTAGDALYLRIYFDAGANFNAITGSLGQQSGTFDVFGVKVEQGPSATPYQFPEIESELLKCQRYFVNVVSVGGIGAGIWGGDITIGLTYINYYKFPVQMRAVPAIATTAVVTSGSFPGASTPYATNTYGHALFRTAAATANGQFYSDTLLADARL
jgi:hypothetical protein